MIKQVRFRTNALYNFMSNGRESEVGDSKWDMCADPVFEIFDIS